MQKIDCYRMEHPQYGVLRVLETEQGAYFYLKDVLRIFGKNAREAFSIIANSEGELLEFGITLAPEKAEDNFISDEELGIAALRALNINTDEIFIDKTLLQDFEVKLSDSQKLATKWIHDFVENVLTNGMTTSEYKGLGVVYVCDYQWFVANDIRYNSEGLVINEQVIIGY